MYVCHNAQFKKRKIKIVVGERGGKGVDWACQAQDRDEWLTVANTLMNCEFRTVHSNLD